MEIAYCCRETKPFAYSILEFVFFNRRAYRVSVSFASYSFLYFISHCFLFSISIALASSSICDEFEEMSMHAGERPKETAEVVALQNYLNECKEKRIVKLKNEIKAAAERVVFLLYHATLDGNVLYAIYFIGSAEQMCPYFWKICRYDSSRRSFSLAFC